MKKVLYEMKIEDETTDGVFAVSLVNSPAIKSDYVLLSNELPKIEIKLDKLVDKKKKIVCGAILIPDMVIERDGYDIIFRKDTIRKISENFIIQGNKDNITLQHQMPVNKINLVESWIVEDTEKDKSAFLGYNLPVGSWMASYKINDDNIWTEFIESGVLKGFSLEGNFAKNEVQLCDCDSTTTTAPPEPDEIDKEILSIYLAITYPEKEQEAYYKWEVGKGENCPSCKEFNGQIHKLKDWITKAIPGVPNGSIVAGLSTSFPHSPFGTYCEDACNCKLVKVQSPDFISKHIVKPW